MTNATKSKADDHSLVKIYVSKIGSISVDVDEFSRHPNVVKQTNAIKEYDVLKKQSDAKSPASQDDTNAVPKKSV